MDLNAIQLDAAQAFRTHRQMVILAPTGSGKTLAYLLPLSQELLKQEREQNSDAGRALVLVPSRELAIQTVDVVRQHCRGLVAAACYGGRPAMEEHRMLREMSPKLIVATPGRCLDHLRKGNLRGESFSSLVIDEFDKCLELGFMGEMTEILDLLPCLLRRILLSATESESIPQFFSSTGDDQLFRLDYLSPEDDALRIRIHEVLSPEKDKLQTLRRLLLHLGRSQSIVFVNHRESVARVAKFLQQEGFAVSAFHGGMEQRDRERALNRFAGGAALTLVSTDLAARGLDIQDVAHIIHYHLPMNAETLVHRNGRTARWDKDGDAWFILGPDEDLHSFEESCDHVEHHDLPSSLTTLLPPKPLWQTIYIGKGKKDKINKVDIVGFLSKQGGLERDELGRIDVGPNWSFASVAYHRANDVLQRIQGLKIKGIKTLYELTT